MLNCFKKNKPPKEVFVANLDYDALATAIVKAQETANEKTAKNDDTAYLTKSILQYAFFAVGAFLIATSCYGAYAVFTTSYSLLQRILYIVPIAFFLFCAFIVFRMIKSVGKIKDRIYLVSLFSTIVAMAALIVAIVKG